MKISIGPCRRDPDASLDALIWRASLAMVGLTFVWPRQSSPVHAQSRECLAAQQQCQDAQQTYRRCLGENKSNLGLACTQLRLVTDKSCDQEHYYQLVCIG